MINNMLWGMPLYFWIFAFIYYQGGMILFKHMIGELELFTSEDSFLEKIGWFFGLMIVAIFWVGYFLEVIIKILEEREHDR